MSNGLSTPPRDGSAEARAMTIKNVQIDTVTTAEIRPTVLGEKRGVVEVECCMQRLSTLAPHTDPATG
jgi:hypothetical protein